MDNRELVLSFTESQLKTIFDKESSKIVGKVMRRFEILENLVAIKHDTKELIYEGRRDLRDIISLSGRGMEPSYWEFKKREG